jgi:hypothetical protein
VATAAASRPDAGVFFTNFGLFRITKTALNSKRAQELTLLEDHANT